MNLCLQLLIQGCLCEGMIAYGMAKASVHQLVASLADSKSGLPVNASVAAILPLVFLCM